MSDDLTPKPTSSGADDPEMAKARQAQLRRARERAAQRLKGATTDPSHDDHAAGDEAAATASSPLDPVAHSETYRALRAEDRVVMRHEIALNLDSFRAAPEDFVAHTPQDYPPLRPAQTPFFSVIIPNYNGARFLPTVFTALQQQTLQDFEVILADDASTDDSVALVERSYPAVRILVNRRNLGFVRTCNLAVAAAHGRYVVLLNNDTEPERNWLAELAKVICANPQAAIVSSKLLLFAERTKLHTTGDLLGRDGIPRNRGVWEEDRGQYDGQPEIFSGCGGAAAYRKELWQQLNGFDEDFWMYMEDVDFSFRCQLVGWRAVFAPQARVYHHLSATGGGTMASYYVGRNTIWMIAKNMPTALLLRNWEEICGAQVKVAIAALRNLRGAAARARLRGQIAGLLGLPRQLRKRQLIQQRRQVNDWDLHERLV